MSFSQHAQHAQHVQHAMETQMDPLPAIAESDAKRKCDGDQKDEEVEDLWGDESDDEEITRIHINPDDYKGGETIRIPFRDDEGTMEVVGAFPDDCDVVFVNTRGGGTKWKPTALIRATLGRYNTFTVPENGAQGGGNLHFEQRLRSHTTVRVTDGCVYLLQGMSRHCKVITKKTVIATTTRKKRQATPAHVITKATSTPFMRINQESAHFKMLEGDVMIKGPVGPLCTIKADGLVLCGEQVDSMCDISSKVYVYAHSLMDSCLIKAPVVSCNYIRTGCIIEADTSVCLNTACVRDPCRESEWFGGRVLIDPFVRISIKRSNVFAQPLELRIDKGKQYRFTPDVPLEECDRHSHPIKEFIASAARATRV